MGRKHLEFRVIGSMVVTKEEHLGALGELLLQKTLYIGDYAAGFVPTIQGIALFQETSEHVGN
jgi:hypothetical protein